MCILVSGFVQLNPAKAGLPLHLGSSYVHLNPANLNLEYGSGALGSVRLKHVSAALEFGTYM